MAAAAAAAAASLQGSLVHHIAATLPPAARSQVLDILRQRRHGSFRVSQIKVAHEREGVPLGPGPPTLGFCSNVPPRGAPPHQIAARVCGVVPLCPAPPPPPGSSS